MAVVHEEILAALLENGIYITGQPNTTSYAKYTYRVSTELKQIIINITPADTCVFSGDSEFNQILSQNRQVDYLLTDFTLQLALLGLREREHFTINKDSHTMVINFAGYNKLFERKATTFGENNKVPKKNFRDLLKGVTTIFSLTSPNLHEVAETISKIMDNKNPCFRIMPNNDRSAYEFYADGGLSENLARQLRDSFRMAAFSVLNLPGQMPITEQDLPDCQQAVINNALPATFNKYIAISKYLYDLLIRAVSNIKAEPPKKIEDISHEGPNKTTRTINFSDEAEGTEPVSRADEPQGTEPVSRADEPQGKRPVTSDEKGKKKKVNTNKRESFAASAKRLSTMENSNTDGIEWSALVTSGLAADMEDIIPKGLEITLENKYLICDQLENFFLNTEKIKSLKMINFLFVNVLEFKDRINIHKHETSDYFLFKKNTDSWQKLIKSIRNRAFELLEEEVSILKDDLEAIKILGEQRNKDIFKLHRANAFFLKIGRTSTVKKIDALIEERQKMYIDKKKSAALSDLSLKKS